MSVSEWALSAALALPAMALGTWLLLLRREMKDEDERRKKED